MDKHILFFTADQTPTADELAQAEKLGDNVTFRCVRYCDPTRLEVADGIAGMVPAVYAEARTSDGAEPRYAWAERPPATPIAEPAPKAPGADPGATAA